MEEKNGTGIHWLIFSFVVVVTPILFGVFLSYIANKNLPKLEDLLTDIILMLFSISCSLLSICYEVYKQRKEKCVKVVLALSISLLFITWSLYVVSKIWEIEYAKEICIGCLTAICFCGILGMRFGNKSDKNTNAKIRAMHNNCLKIRKKLLSQECNEALEPHVVRAEDLLCNPNEFDRVEITLNKYLKDGDKRNEGKK